MAARPTPLGGLRHVALFVRDLAACEHFYVELLGMAVEWRPDPDNVYLCSGCDNLALHTWEGESFPQPQRLDHIGFIIDRIEDVDAWFTFLKEQGVTMRKEPKTHRDGARSFYCLDPEGVLVQMIYHPPISGARFVGNV
ncbi:VOC family protein [Isoalcanivorax beigongshangi]|uniref:VOC family protein n=1 Tax=Isoalcanivorax beigongshangi TaxID=3238810 RepID=A0ABV4AHD4_9GAMM